MRLHQEDQQTPPQFDALIVGAGFAGMYMLHRLQQCGLTVKVIEAATDVGGTWYWNRYPGARCDIESVEYSYSFCTELQQSWTWTERYASQPEIFSYAQHVAQRFDLYPHIQFATTVSAALFDEKKRRWQVRTDNGAHYEARFLILASGCLSKPYEPDFPGKALFAGVQCHTSRWPHEGIQLEGKQVAIIGTGSSGIQLVSTIAPHVRHLYVFQRSANFSVPARNQALSPAFIQWVKDNYPAIRQRARKNGLGLVEPPAQSCAEADAAARQLRFDTLWEKGGTQFLLAFNDIKNNAASNQIAAQYVTQKIQDIVKDPITASRLIPTDHPIGTKRICVDTGYYATFNRANVTLIDAKTTPIHALHADAIETTDSRFPVDVIIYATGFDALTGAILDIDIRGKNGLALREHWSAGASAYLGIATSAFPNLFMLNGPGSVSVLSNALVSIEHHVEWLSALLAHATDRGFTLIEARDDAEQQWVQTVKATAEATLYPRANSWYRGANIPGKPRGFIPYAGGIGAFREYCTRVATRNYEGFSFA